MAALQQFPCSACGKVLKTANPVLEGTRVKCPYCGQPSVVGAAPPRMSGGEQAFTPPRANYPPPASPRTGSAVAVKPRTSTIAVLAICFFVSALFLIPPYLLCRGLILGLANFGESIQDLGSQDISDKPADFTFTAEEYNNTVNSATGTQTSTERDAILKKYRGKVIEVSGKVNSYGRKKEGNAYVTLEKSIGCQTADEEPWATVAPQQEIKVKGRLTALSFPGLVDCVIVDPGVSVAVPITAEQLAGEYAEDKEATNQKYKDKYLVVRGQVAEHQFESNESTLLLKGQDKVRVSFFFSSKKIPTQQRGEPVKLIGIYSSFQVRDSDVSLTDCQLITK